MCELVSGENMPSLERTDDRELIDEVVLLRPENGDAEEVLLRSEEGEENGAELRVEALESGSCCGCCDDGGEVSFSVSANSGTCCVGELAGMLGLET